MLISALPLECVVGLTYLPNYLTYMVQRDLEGGICTLCQWPNVFVMCLLSTRGILLDVASGQVRG